MKNPLRIGTRASKLARTQAQMLADMLIGAHPQLVDRIEIVAMTTAGDRELHKHMTDWGYKGLFTRELEDALSETRIDLAVHSVKDMPSELPDGLILAGMLARTDMRDAWISSKYPSFAGLPAGAVVGTSSARRAAQLLHRQRSANIVPLRGNVETRLRKLEEGAAEATFLSLMGLERLGLAQHVREIIAPEIMLPAVAQGVIGIECRAGDDDMLALLATISDKATITCVTAERAMLRELDGSCRTPIAGLAQLKDDQIFLRGEVLSLDGAIRHYREASGASADAEALGIALGRELRARAGDALLKVV